MAETKSKSFIKKLGFIKNYISLIVPVIIMLVAIVLLIVAPLMSGKLAEQIEKESISRLGKPVKTLMKTAVPSSQIRIEEAYQKDYEQDAKHIAGFAAQSTQRELLSYAIFPEPRETSLLIFDDFASRFCQGVHELIERINGLDCPTGAEINKIMKLSGRKSSPFKAGPGMMGGGRTTQNDVGATILDALCREKAESATVYVNPYDIAGYGFWENFEFKGREEAIEDCWYWQLGYWIIEDVIDTIAAMNTGSEKVFDSPVKRLMTIGFSMSQRTGRSAGGMGYGGGGYGGGGYGGGGMGGGGGGFAVSSGSALKSRADDTRPDYVLSSTEGLTDSCTGRFCNDEFDVVHFNVMVLIRTRDIPAFMQQLCNAKSHTFRGFSGNQPVQQLRHNQITILESTISSINRDDQAHNMYRYGEGAVVQLDLICEYLFSRAGYEKIKPKLVKDMIAELAVQDEQY